MTNLDNDTREWQAFKNGDRDAFQSIYFVNYSGLAEYGQRFTPDKELVKDSIQDLFVKLWANKNNLGDVIKVRPYLLVSLRSTLLNAMVKNSRIKTTEFTNDLPFEMVFSVESEYIKNETHSLKTQQIIDALNQLTPRQKEIIYLRFFEEMPYDEIAASMGITVKATYKLYARGLEALRNIIDISPASLLAILSLHKYLIFQNQ